MLIIALQIICNSLLEYYKTLLYFSKADCIGGVSFHVWKGIRVIIQIRLMPYSIYVIWMLIMLYHKVTCCIRSLNIVFWIIPFGYCVPPIKL